MGTNNITVHITGTCLHAGDALEHPLPPPFSHGGAPYTYRTGDHHWDAIEPQVPNNAGLYRPRAASTC